MKPIATYNQKQERAADPVRFEPALVEAVLEGVKAGAIDLETTGRGKLDLPGRKEGPEVDSAKRRIEAPYLQVVMTRIWDEESRHGSSLLQLATFQRLGGAVGIVQKHLDEVLGRLSRSERAVAEVALTYLVTPSGTKIALEPSYLAERTGHSAERIASVLDRLASSDCRVLRKLDSSGQTVTRYEIFHDVLARVVVDDYVPRIKRRRIRNWLIGMAASLLLAIGLFGFAGWEWWQAQKATNIAQDAYKQVQDAKGKIETQARLALSRQLGLQVKTSLEESYPRALLLGAEALYRGSEKWEARDGLMRGEFTAGHRFVLKPKRGQCLERGVRCRWEDARCRILQGRDRRGGALGRGAATSGHPAEGRGGRCPGRGVRGRREDARRCVLQWRDRRGGALGRGAAHWAPH